MENRQQTTTPSTIPYINCIVGPADDFRAERHVEFALLGKPIIPLMDMYIGEVTLTLFRSGDHVESVYNIFYFVDGGWKVIRYNRLGLPDNLGMVIDELGLLAHRFVDDDSEEDEAYRFNHELAGELTERLNYFRHHVKLTARFKRVKDIIQFDSLC